MLCVLRNLIDMVIGQSTFGSTAQNLTRDTCAVRLRRDLWEVMILLFSNRQEGILLKDLRDTVDERNPAPPEKPGNHDTNQQWFPTVSKWCRISSIRISCCSKGCMQCVSPNRDDDKHHPPPPQKSDRKRARNQSKSPGLGSRILPLVNVCVYTCLYRKG